MNNFSASSLGMAIFGLFSILLLSACGGGGGGGVPTGTGPFSISGSITPVSGSRIDSDVNDPAYNDPILGLIENNTMNQAQALPNPVTLGGFVSVTGSGLPGSNFAMLPDTQDFFRVPMLGGQVVNLHLANRSSNLDLILYDIFGTELVRPQSGLGQNESITVPGNFSGAQDFFIEVRAIDGVSNYTLTIGLSSLSINSNELEHDFVPGEVIVRFKDKVLPAGITEDSLAMRANSVGLQAVSGAPGRSMLMQLGDTSQLSVAKKKLKIAESGQRVKSELQHKLDTIKVVKALSRRNDVKSARLNYIYKPLAMPDDSNFPAQWHFPQINLPQAWDISKGSTDVIVAVIDTGVLLSHPDFVNLDSSSQLVPGFDFIRNATVAADGESDGIIVNGIVTDMDSIPNDPGDQGLGFASTFHGTHVAGTIAAATNNGIGVAGVGWNVKVMPLRALGVGGGNSYDIEQAVLFAAGLPNASGTVPAPGQEADVINLSLGGACGIGPIVTPEAYTRARDAGVIIVAAAGNDASADPVCPASYDDAVISVSAVDLNKNRAYYSNFGSHVDVAGPGGDASQNLNGDGFADGIMSTAGSDFSSSLEFTYGLKQGTSMATPHIAGVAALMKSVYSSLTPDEFVSALPSITEDLGLAGRDDLYGYGLIDALDAVLTAQQLAAGGTLPDNPFMVASPGSINFGTSAVSATLNVRNIGTGATPLTITSVTNDSGGWLTHMAPVGGGVLGDYTFIVDRSSLANDGIYSATITIVSSVNTVTIPVIMQKTSIPTFDDAGLLYVLVARPGEEIALEQAITTAINGKYTFRFDGEFKVPAGEYLIYAGTDMDNDGAICNEGEACGIYPNSTPDSNTFLLDKDLTDVDLIAGFANLFAGNAQAAATANIPASGIAIKRVQP